MTTQLKDPSVASSLYEEDFALWLDQTVQQIKNRQFDTVDWENLLEEIDSLGKELRNKVESYLRQLLLHLLLYRYWEAEKAYCAKGWSDEIDNFRFQLNQLTRSKTLYNYLLEIFSSTYLNGRKRAIQKTKLAADIFPIDCPFTVEQALNSDYFPD